MRAPLYLASVIVLLLGACTLERADPLNARSADSTSAGHDTTAQHRYGIRSGRLVAVSVRPGQSRPDTSIFTFDDHGRMERSEQEVEVPTRDRGSVRARTVVIRNGQTLYTLDVSRKVARKTDLSQQGADGRSIDFMRLTDAQLKDYHVTRQGTDTVLGRPCDVFRIDDADNEMTGTYYVWMNIPLQIDIVIRGARITTRPLSLEENIAIDASVFEVPSSYRLLDTQ